MMLDAMRQWPNDSNSWLAAAGKMFKNSGLSQAQLQHVWSEFRVGGYFSVNGGVNFAATQRLMDMFFRLRHESPNGSLSKPAEV